MLDLEKIVKGWQRFGLIGLMGLILFFVAGCSSEDGSADNPFLSPPELFDEAVPFDQIELEDYIPAIKKQAEDFEAVIAEIIANPEEPTFENTIDPLYYQQRQMAQAYDVLMFLSEVVDEPDMAEVVDEAMYISIRAEDAVAENQELFQRVKTVYENTDWEELIPEEAALLEKIYWDAIDLGVALNDEDQERISTSISEITENEVVFNRNVLADYQVNQVHVTDESRLDGLAEEHIDEAAVLAQEENLDGWLFTYESGLLENILTDVHDSSLREEAWYAARFIANYDDENDNKQVLLDVINERLSVAQLLGHENYASLFLQTQMAKTPAKVDSFIKDLTKPAVAGSSKEIGRFLDYVTEQNSEMTMEPWDYVYYQDKMRRDLQGDLADEATEYFPVNQVVEGIFDLYNSLYGLEFVLNEEMPVYAPQVQVYEVWDQKEERYLGLLYMDLFTRPGKGSGGYVLMLRSQYWDGEDDVRPHAMLVCDFWPPDDEYAGFLSLGEIKTLLHETGHAMHVLLSDVYYGADSGYEVQTDFSEMPSTVMENFAYNKDFMQGIGRHYDTGEMISSKLLQAMWAEDRFMAFTSLVEDLQLAKLDMSWHEIRNPVKGSVKAFEDKALKSLQVRPQGEYADDSILSGDFTHIVSGGYAASYYSYLWCEALAGSAYERMVPNGKINPQAVAAFRSEILSRGGTEPGDVLFGRFDPKFVAAGSQPDPAVILRRRGLQ